MCVCPGCGRAAAWIRQATRRPIPKELRNPAQGWTAAGTEGRRAYPEEPREKVINPKSGCIDPHAWSTLPLRFVMGWQGTDRAMRAAERRQQREEQNRQRELARQTKEQAKLSAIEQARLEVSTYENRIEILRSVHKEQGQIWDWTGIAASLPPPIPEKHCYHELRARQRACLVSPEQQPSCDSVIAEARLQDEQDYQQALLDHAAEIAEWEKLKTLSRRILAGEPKAYTEALVELSPLRELSELGSTLYFTLHDAQLLECVLKVNGIQAIPAEVKSLTSTEKLSIKPMPRARFHELYQDHICSCILRVAREVLALLPANAVLITASADSTDPTTGHGVEQPVLSAVLPRSSMVGLDYEHLDPSDALENFLHRGDFRASRKVGGFSPIVPLKPADIPCTASQTADHGDLLARARHMREDLHAELAKFSPRSPAPAI